MSFIRPQARASLMRYREALTGLILVLLGLWWALNTGGLLGFVAPAIMLAGAALVWLGWQRARFRVSHGGRGAVVVDEGQVAYMGPLTGGAVSLRELDRLILDGSQFPAHWRLEQRGQDPVLIPVDALGADALFDAFASLPGLRTDRMLAELETNTSHPAIIWQRHAPTAVAAPPSGGTNLH